MESRFQIKVEQMEMIGQDYMSRAAENVVDYLVLKAKLEETLVNLESS